MPTQPSEPVETREWIAWQQARLFQTLMAHFSLYDGAVMGDNGIAREARLVLNDLRNTLNDHPAIAPIVLSAMTDATADPIAILDQ